MKAYLLVFLTLQIFTNAIKLEYIVAYYAANTRYNNFEMGIPSRKGIITEVHGSPRPYNDPFIQAGDPLNLVFNTPPKSLESLFDSSKDPKVVFISRIDFKDFNSSLLENVNRLFYGCTGLKEINFAKLDTSKIRNMNYFFIIVMN